MKSRLIIILPLVAVLAGCTNPGRDARADAAHTFETNLMAETEAVLSEAGRSLTFSNAVALAHDRTLKLSQQDLEAKLARITRATAFSSFLPNVGFTYGDTLFAGSVHHLPTALGGSMRTSGSHVYGGAMLVAQPVFTPVAWIMFAETQYGVRIQDIVRERAGQLLDVQVASLFYEAAVSQRLVGAYERHLASGQALTNRLTHLVREGYALEADRVRAAARCALDVSSLTEAQADAATTRGRLADILRLWPLADFTVEGDTILALEPLPEKPVEEWVWEALITRKELYAGDQMVELRKAQVIEALANFLPNIVFGGGGANMSLEGLVAKGWGGQLVGTWAAFEGFRSVQQYRRARAERETEFKLQEDRMLSVVIAVTEAYRNLQTVREKAYAARVWAEAARLDHAAAERRYADGQETFSVVLDKLAEADEAEVKALQADYAESLAAILLRQAVGLDLYHTKGSHP